MQINGRSISQAHKPYIIAEISANHNGSIESAFELISAAKKCGADAVKLQTYTADTITLNCKTDDFLIKEGPWKDKYLYDLYKQAETPFEWTGDLINYGKKIGITVFSTPFDETAVDLLESLDVPAYKIASFEITDIPLIRYVAKTRKPIIISTGMASDDEISEAISTIYDSGSNDIVLLHCISAYPTPLKEANVSRVSYLRDQFGVPVGLSDHTLSNYAAMASVALGACVIEKHFTIDRSIEGPDSQFSIEQNELKNLCSETENIWQSLGTPKFERTKAELNNKMFRRSIYFCKNASSGSQIDYDLIRRVRPGFGLDPKYYDQIIGKRLVKDVKIGMPVHWTHIDEK